MSRNNNRPNNLSVVAKKADNISKVLAVITTLISIFTILFWWKTDSENKILENKLKQTELTLKQLTLIENELKNAQLKPRFSVLYFIFGGAVYDAIKTGDLGENSKSTFGKIKKNKDAKAAYENLYEYPLIETDIESHMKTNQLNSFLNKYSYEPLKKRGKDSLNAVKYTVLSIACFGGTTAKDVELIYEERTVPNEAFFFPPEGIRYIDNSIQYAEGAPIQSDVLVYNKKIKSLKLGDIEPGHGRIIPVQIGLAPEDVYYKNGDPVHFEVISSFHIKPLKIKFTTLSGEIIEQPIREQLDIPMPVSDFIDIRG